MQVRIFVGYPSIHWISIGCPQVGLGYLTDIQHPQFADLDMELISKSADMPQPSARVAPYEVISVDSTRIKFAALSA